MEGPRKARALKVIDWQRNGSVRIGLAMEQDGNVTPRNRKGMARYRNVTLRNRKGMVRH